MLSLCNQLIKLLPLTGYFETFKLQVLANGTEFFDDHSDLFVDELGLINEAQLLGSKALYSATVALSDHAVVYHCDLV